MANYTAAFVNHAQSFINDLLLAGGLSNADKNTSGRYYNYISNSCKEEAKVVCTELLKKKFDFAAVDRALETMANLSTLCTNSLTSNRRYSVDGNTKLLAEYVAWFCKQINFKWDDTKLDPNKRDQLKKYTIFGAALADAYRFKSEDEPAPATTSVNPRTGNPPQNDYKAQGPQSGKARGLIGTPGQKETLNGGNLKVFVCEFDKKGANVPYLFVDPIGSKGDAGNGINRVIAGSANGYTDCRCYFATRADADAFLANFVSKYSAKQRKTDKGTIVYDYSKYVGLCVREARNMPGFYKVATECGDCYINAKMLNEDIDEELTEATKQIPADVAKEVEQAAETVQSYNIYDIDVYEEAFNRYI